MRSLVLSIGFLALLHGVTACGDIDSISFVSKPGGGQGSGGATVKVTATQRAAAALGLPEQPPAVVDAEREVLAQTLDRSGQIVVLLASSADLEPDDSALPLRRGTFRFDPTTAPSELRNAWPAGFPLAFEDRFASLDGMVVRLVGPSASLADCADLLMTAWRKP